MSDESTFHGKITVWEPPSLLQLRRLRAEAILPTRATPGSAGLDLFFGLTAAQVIDEGGRFLASTGWAVAIAPGYEGQIRPRSGLAMKHGITVLNAPGTIDSDYRGELCVLLVNHGSRPTMIRPGDRIAQLVIAPVAMVDPVEVDALPETERGSGGFGSTGR